MKRILAWGVVPALLLSAGCSRGLSSDLVGKWEGSRPSMMAPWLNVRPDLNAVQLDIAANGEFTLVDSLKTMSGTISEEGGRIRLKRKDASRAPYYPEYFIRDKDKLVLSPSGMGRPVALQKVQ